MDFEPILIKDVEDNGKDKPPSDEQEYDDGASNEEVPPMPIEDIDNNGEVLVQEIEALAKEVPNKDPIPTPKELMNLELQTHRKAGVKEA